MGTSQINLNLLETFLVLSDTLNFSETASRLHISQPSVSRQIQQLEDALGCKLFVRNRHTVTLSPEGTALRNRTKPLLGELETTLSAIQDGVSKPKGNMAVACLSEVGHRLFEHVLLPLIDTYPDIELQMHYQPEEQNIDDLKEGRVNFAIVSHPIILEGIRTYPLLDERVLIVTSRSNPQTLANCTNPEFVYWQPHDPLYSEFQRKHPKIFSQTQPVNKISVNSYPSVIDAVIHRQAWAISPWLGVRKDLARGNLRIDTQAYLERKLFLACREGDLVQKKHQILLEFIRLKAKDLEAQPHETPHS